MTDSFLHDWNIQIKDNPSLADIKIAKNLLLAEIFHIVKFCYIEISGETTLIAEKFWVTKHFAKVEFFCLFYFDDNLAPSDFSYRNWIFEFDLIQYFPFYNPYFTNDYATS